ncbi:hypothetical protein FACS189440_16610 [Bacteroidia bacterium]|nr:hypothetical protein FACS189440_16610 [Bacteroidia bacterium]
MKMKKMIFLMLALLVWGAASMNAQVTIGSESEPHVGAVLDLQSTKGLLLPNVWLTDVKTFGLAADDTKGSATGMLVYNTNPAIINGQGRGLYVWDGVADSWSFAGISGPVAVPATSILVSVADGAASVTSGGTLQFLFQVVPSNATNQNVTWSIDQTSVGGGSINAAGLFTAGTAGTVVIKAAAADGSGVYGLKQVTVNPADELVSSVTVTSAGSATSLNAGSTLQLYADVQTTAATNRTVTWSIIEGDAANVNSSGLVSGTKAGTVKVQALANDGSGKKGDITLTVILTTGAGSETIGSHTYTTYCYGGSIGCWMTQNSQEGTANYTNGANKYYSWDQRNNACPSGWSVPSQSQWENLQSYLNNTATSTEKAMWNSGSALAGRYGGSTLLNSGSLGRWWSSSASYQYFGAPSGSNLGGPDTGSSSYSVTVRCIKN